MRDLLAPVTTTFRQITWLHPRAIRDHAADPKQQTIVTQKQLTLPLRFKPLKARNLTPDTIQTFLDGLSENFAPSTVNHYRTILNSAFNYAIRWKRYDDNPVIPIKQVPEREARDRFVEVSELVALVEQCQRQKDLELLGFIFLAACTGLRKGGILPRKWDDVQLDVDFPFIHLWKKDSKNKRSNRLPLPRFLVHALKQLPSYGVNEYLFPTKANVKHKENFKKPHAWDLGKRFRRICKLAKVKDLGTLRLPCRLLRVWQMRLSAR